MPPKKATAQAAKKGKGRGKQGKAAAAPPKEDFVVSDGEVASPTAGLTSDEDDGMQARLAVMSLASPSGGRAPRRAQVVARQNVARVLSTADDSSSAEDSAEDAEDDEVGAIKVPTAAALARRVAAARQASKEEEAESEDYAVSSSESEASEGSEESD